MKSKENSGINRPFESDDRGGLDGGSVVPEKSPPLPPERDPGESGKKKKEAIVNIDSPSHSDTILSHWKQEEQFYTSVKISHNFTKIHWKAGGCESITSDLGRGFLLDLRDRQKHRLYFLGIAFQLQTKSVSTCLSSEKHPSINEIQMDN